MNETSQNGGGDWEGCPFPVLRRGTQAAVTSPGLSASHPAGHTSRQGFQEGQEGALGPNTPTEGRMTRERPLWLEELGLTPKAVGPEVLHREQPPTIVSLFLSALPPY